jgi:PAS domain S-box-containing protein
MGHGDGGSIDATRTGDRASDATGGERGDLDPSWFQRAVESAGHAIFVTDSAGHIVYVNPAFEDITGYPTAEAIGRTPNLLNSGHHDPEYFRRLWETITRGEVWDEEVVNRRRDGAVYVADQTIAPVTDSTDGTISHFVSIQTDVTEQREYQRALERRQDLSDRTEEKVDIGGWELSPETGEVRWTAGTRRIHEVPPGYEPSLETGLEFYHPSDRDRVEDAVADALEWDLSYDMEARLITAEGNTRLVRTTGERVESDDGETLLRGTITDITDEETLRQQLMVFNRILRHNLRNQLNVVLGQASRLRASLGAPDSGPATDDGASRSADPSTDRKPTGVRGTEARDGLEVIISATEDLLSTAERAREFDRVYQQLHEIRSLEVRPIVEAVATEVRATAPDATIDIEGITPVLFSNRDAVRLILEELVDNAVEHAADPEPVVTISLRADTVGSLRLRVADEGPGIPDLERQVIVEGDETQLRHGSGIGLWVVKWLLTPIGGSLEISENEPTGTVVELVFPPSRWKHVGD